MVVSLEQMIDGLEGSGILSADELKSFIPPEAFPEDANELGYNLIDHGKLTEFQVEQVSNGSANSLVLSNYILVDKIGSGGMGQVYKAEHRRMQRIVALKLLPQNVMNDQAAIDRFEREVRAAAKLNHPNIVVAYDSDCVDGVHFLVMECVDGSDLSSLIKKDGVFAVEQVIDYITQAARGLEAAHAEGVVHRDVKPSNLLLSDDGTIKILDMGLARIEDTNLPAKAELTSTGTVMGTVDYMAPEQALDTKTADGRADIYGLGCSLFYLLCGKPIYDGNSLTAKLLAHREEPIPSLRSSRPEVPESLEMVFRKMVAKSMNERYQSVADVIVDLERCVTGSDQTAEFRKANVSVSESELTKIVHETEVTSSESSETLTLAPHTVKSRRKLILIGCSVSFALMGFVGLRFQNEISAFLDKNDFNTPTGEQSPNTTIRRSQAGEQLAFRSPGFALWLNDVSSMPAKEQVDVVAKKLQELNPEFDGKVRYSIEEGVVEEFAVLTDDVTDLSPVRAFATLKELNCSGNWQSGILTDLSPLKGMPLALLKCSSTKVTDLTPIIGMQLTYLDIGATRVADLSPLMGMPLTKLFCRSTSVSDLSPLHEANLTELICNDTKVSDLSPLGGMPLTKLNFDYTGVADLTPLEEMPLHYLSCNGTSVSDLSPLKRMPLKFIGCNFFNPIRDAELLRSITTLETINHKPAAKFWKELEDQQP